MSRPQPAAHPAFDVIVVGAGTAGCVVASRAARAGLRVALLEAGPAQSNPDANILDIGPNSDVAIQEAAELAGERIMLPRGRVVGGSGAVNGGYCLAARPSDLREWPGSDWPAWYRWGLARAVERIRPSVVLPGVVARKVLTAFPGAGLPVPLARHRGVRGTAWSVYRPDLSGTEIETNVEVCGLKWSGGISGTRCTGVLLADGREVESDIVVLAAGTIATTRILLSAGIGPATGHSVGVRIAEHPEMLLDLEAECNRDPTSQTRKAGPLLRSIARIGVHDQEFEVRPYEVPFDLAIPGLSPQPMRIGIAAMSPGTRGEIRAANGTMTGAVNGTTTEAVRGDIAVVLDAHPAAEDAHALAAAVDEVRDRLGLDGPQKLTTSQHLGCATPIGEVVDESGCVYGIEGLRIADASVFPELPACGPYLSVLAVAEVLSIRLINEKLG